LDGVNAQLAEAVIGILSIGTINQQRWLLMNMKMTAVFYTFEHQLILGQKIIWVLAPCHFVDHNLMKLDIIAAGKFQ
jgi:hypothetical protein